MNLSSIAILMPGDMGHGVGRALREHGFEVITALSERSDRTRSLASAAGIRDVGTLANAVNQAGLILSILPPASALDLARDTADAMRKTDRTPVFVDCNAVSPQTVSEVSKVMDEANAPFIDAGIIGLAPGKAGGTRFYVSGRDVAPMLALNGMGFSVIAIGDEPGRASSLKMTYAGLTKGTWTLQTAVLLAARQLGVLPELLEEFQISQSHALEIMKARVPSLPADSGRWIGEMEEIAATFAEAGVTSGFHDGAAEVFRVLAQTPFASETRETMNKDRTLEEALKTFCEYLRKP